MESTPRPLPSVWDEECVKPKISNVYKTRSSKRAETQEYPMKLIKNERPLSPDDISIQDDENVLNAQISDDIYIDTRDLCLRISSELKQHAIPQSTFAEKILCRSQGTLSDLLRNPRPWNELKSGRETFRRMFNWLQQPLHVRLSILDMYNGPSVSQRTEKASKPPKTDTMRERLTKHEKISSPVAKKNRFVFTETQKRTLQAIFNETQRPSREMQETIANHLHLAPSSVANFFMNQRRRSAKKNELHFLD